MKQAGWLGKEIIHLSANVKRGKFSLEGLVSTLLAVLGL